MSALEMLPPRMKIEKRLNDILEQMSTTENSDYFNFMMSMVGFKFEKHDKWEVYEILKEKESELIEAIKGNHPRFKLIKSSNYGHFFLPRPIN